MSTFQAALIRVARPTRLAMAFHPGMFIVAVGNERMPDQRAPCAVGASPLAVHHREPVARQARRGIRRLRYHRDIDNPDLTGITWYMTLSLVKTMYSIAVVAALSCCAAGCRQSDGAMPTIQREVTNRLGDLSRDLQSVAGGEEQAKADFADDLRVFARSPGGEAAAAAWGLRVAGAVANSNKLTEQAAQQLAHTSWTVVAGTQLSERQAETLKNDLKAQLLALGVAEDQSASLAEQVLDVQKAVTTRARRWYEIL